MPLPKLKKIWLAPLLTSLILLGWYTHDYQTTLQAQNTQLKNLPEGRTLLFADGDSYQWVTLAQDAAKNSSPWNLWRTHHIQYDNAPTGRLQHWATPYLTYIILLGKIDHALTGKPINSAIEKAALLANPLLIVFLGTFIIFLFARTTEPIAGSIVALICLIPPAHSFLSAHPDHHGILQICTILTIFGAGKALTSPNQKWLYLAGISLGILLWHSAFTAIPIIAALTIGAALSTQNGTTKPLWELLFYSAAITALTGYLFEYFPYDLHLDLDINNPFYIVALCGCGILLKAQRDITSKQILPTKTLILGSLALLAPLLFFLIQGEQALHILNPFYSEYMKILAKSGEEMGGINISKFTPPHLLIIVLALASTAKALEKNRLCLWGLPIVLISLTLSLLFIRTISLGFASLLIITLLTWKENPWPKTLLPALLLPAAITSLQTTDTYFAFPNARTLADQIRFFHKLPENPTVLSIPDHNLALAYYLNGSAIATSNWENSSRLKAMHERMALPDSPKTQALIREADIVITDPKDNRHIRSAQLLFGNTIIPQNQRPLWEKFQNADAQHPAPIGWKELQLQSSPYRVWMKN